MINKNRYLAIIPARKGSKELKDKNIKLFNQLPLIELSIIQALSSKKINKVIINTNDSRILKLSNKYNNVIFQKRKEALSKSNSMIFDTIKDILNNEKNNYNNFILLQPTSPLRKNNTIDSAIKYYEKHKNNFCVSVSKSKQNKENLFQLQKNKLKVNKKIKKPLNRQQYKDNYFINGSIYIANINKYLSSKTFITNGTSAFLMPNYLSIDIDNELDFFIAEKIYRKYFNR